MNCKELVRALEDESQLPKFRVEDILVALADLCAETLEQGGGFRLAGIGVFRLRMHGGKPAINFYASQEMRERLKLANIKPDAEACPACAKRANKAARQRRWEEKKREAEHGKN